MRSAAAFALCFALAGCAGARADRAEARGTSPQRTDYVAVSRALTEIDAAERQGDLVDELEWARAAETGPQDATAQFLAVAAQPPGEDRWSGFRDLSLQFPRSPLPWVGMARTYVGWHTWDQAEKAIAAALHRDPACWLALRVRAELAEARGKLDAARADFRAVLAADPDDPEAHFGLARIAKVQGDAETAHAEAAAALEVARTLPGAWALLGDIAQELGEPGVAADFWEGAVKQAPRDRAARVTLARLRSAQGDAAGARDQWAAAVELREDAESLAALADAAHAAQDAGTEQRALERLSLLNPSSEQWRRVAEVRLAASDLTGAERAYRRILDGSPRDAQANLGLARVHLARGESQQAVEALRSAGDPGRADLAALEQRLNLERVSRPDVIGLQRAVQALVDRTYRRRLAEAPSLAGALRLRVTVDGSGAATLVEVLEDSVHDPDVRACAYWNLQDAAYPPEKPGRYSFAFAFRR